METKQLITAVVSGLASAALVLVVLRAEDPVPTTPKEPGAAKELRQVRAQIESIRRELRVRPPVSTSVAARNSQDAPSEALPAEAEEDELENAPETEEERAAAAEEAARVETQRRLDSLQNRVLVERLDRDATRETEQMLGAIVEDKKLTNLHVDRVQCFETLCQVEVSFDGLERRNEEFLSAVEALRGSNFAHIEDGESLTGEIYVARGDDDLDAEVPLAGF